MPDPLQKARFFGRWHATVGHEQVFLEFLPDGQLAFTGRFGEDTKDYMGMMRHPLEFGLPTVGPTWVLRDGLLVILLKSTKEYTFEYTFSDDGTNLTLKNLRTDERLTFSKKR
jgi:hypothetical protein